MSAAREFIVPMSSSFQVMSRWPYPILLQKSMVHGPCCFSKWISVNEQKVGWWLEKRKQVFLFWNLLVDFGRVCFSQFEVYKICLDSENEPPDRSKAACPGHSRMRYLGVQAELKPERISAKSLNTTRPNCGSTGKMKQTYDQTYDQVLVKHGQTIRQPMVP